MWLMGAGACGIQYVIAKDTKCRIIIIARHFVTAECGFAVTVMRIALYILYSVRQLETGRGARGSYPGAGRVAAGAERVQAESGKNAPPPGKSGTRP